LFTDHKGRAWSFYALTGRWATVMRKARAAKPWLDGFMARELRAVFATVATDGGADDRLLQRYLGHTPATILARHYQRKRDGELGKVVASFSAEWALSSGTILETQSNG
ncbi:MAG: hypothetical protein K1X53_12820, partial [Candidatus Sumerlaeaceae bacterium]|nr:hypothetical protein [Candidatus Sumerlaeaceae bacterium]